jgi:hypothetical protein
MDDLLTYLVPVFALSLLAAGWMAMQLLAKKMNVKNHIDSSGGCCGACDNRDNCSNTDSSHSH